MAERSGRAAAPFLPALRLARVQLEARPWLRAALAAAGTALVALVAALHYVRAPGVLRPVFDDSYISLLFARNLAEHGKLTFDGESWSTGATSILHVALLAVPIKLGFGPFESAIALGVACHVALALAVYWLAWAAFRSQIAAVSAALVISLTGYAAFDAGNGMETSLFMALLAASMAAVLSWRGARGRWMAGVLIGLAILARPEGVFLLAAAGVYLWLDRSKSGDLREFAGDAARLLAPGVAVLALLSLFSLVVTGDLTPGTGTAKLRFFQEDGLPLRLKLQETGDYMGLFMGPLLPTLLIGILAPRRRELALLALFWVPMIACYAVLFPGGLSHYFYRYQHPVLPLIAVMAGGGVAWLMSEAMRRDLVVKALVVGAVAVLAVPLWHHYQRWQVLYRDASFETLVDLEGMARDLNTIVRPGEVVATHDIGAVAYFADFEVLDLVGLVNPDVVPYHKGRHVDLYLSLARPDYLLVFPYWDAQFLRLFPEEHREMYELVKVYPGGSIRKDPYVLYRIRYPTVP